MGSSAAEVGWASRRNILISEISDLYSRRLFRYFRNKVHCNEDAEDLVQETFFRLCTVDDLDGIRNLEAFLFSTAYRLTVDTFRKRQRSPLTFSTSTDVDETLGDMPLAEDRLSSVQELQWLIRKVRVLPRQRRKTFILRKFREMPYQDIADEMGITIGSVRKHLSAAMRDCREFMTTYQ